MSNLVVTIFFVFAGIYCHYLLSCIGCRKREGSIFYILFYHQHYFSNTMNGWNLPQDSGDELLAVCEVIELTDSQRMMT